LRRFFICTLAAIAAGALLLLGIEVLLAFRRDYFREGPGAPITGSFGHSSLPPLRLVVIGDSTSVGVGAKPQESFPWIIAERLGEKFKVELHVVGVSGARIEDAARDQVPAAIALKPDLVLIEIGANDATHLTSAKTVRSKMSQMLDAIEKAKIEVVVAGPPDMGTTRAFAEPLRTLSGYSGAKVQRAIEQVVIPRGISYVDLAAATGPVFNADPTRYYSPDLFHPSAEGYALWAKVIYPAVTEGIKAKGSP
jgi:lysophospholipase L1-like esterase